MRFFKMSNCGNDYIYLFQRPTKEQVVLLCNRNFGVGGDGVVYIYLKNGVYGFEIYNSDGSKAVFCGSVCLSLGLYVYKKEGKKQFVILTDAGEKRVWVTPCGKRVKVALEVGKPRFQSAEMGENIYNKLLFLKCNGKTLRVRATYVNLGNNHLVINGLYSEKERVKIVNAINKSNLFYQGINVEFCEKYKNSARVVVFERGSGKTLCCTSGGCAVFAVLQKTQKCDNGLALKFEGGTLKASVKNKSIIISSYPQFLFSGEWGNIE